MPASTGEKAEDSTHASHEAFAVGKQGSYLLTFFKPRILPTHTAAMQIKASTKPTHKPGKPFGRTAVLDIGFQHFHLPGKFALQAFKQIPPAAANSHFPAFQQKHTRYLAAYATCSTHNNSNIRIHNTANLIQIGHKTTNLNYPHKIFARKNSLS
jgi:hypothetical protein